MLASSTLRKTIPRASRHLATPHNAARHKKRLLSSSQSTPDRPSDQPYKHSRPPPPPETWLTKKLRQSPAAMRVFMRVTGALGYASPKQVAGRRALAMYEELCAGMEEKEMAFWHNECALPPTFQSWFTITNLHVWLLTVRLRSLPAPHGRLYIQALLDHFFLDVEDRIRIVLQPRSDAKRGRAAPERLVGTQMKIFKEQWAGMGMAFDLALVEWGGGPDAGGGGGDVEMAGAVWRNLLGARGARGIAFAGSGESESGGGGFRRSVNLVGGKVENIQKLVRKEGGLEAEEARDDGSGVHDFAPAEADRYVAYPEVMWTIVAYLRRELKRLEGMDDEDVMGAGSERRLAFGSVRVPADTLGDTVEE